MKLRTGKADDNVLDRSVVRRLGETWQKGSAEAADAPGERGRIAAAVDPATMRVREAGFLSVIAAANGLAAEGILSGQAQTVILLPPGSEESLLRSLEDQIREAAQLCHLRITGGHTEVTGAVTRPVVVTAAQALGGLSTAAPGDISRRYSRDSRGRAAMEKTALLRAWGSSPASADEAGTSGSASAPWGIVAAGQIGMEGTYLVATERAEELEHRFPVRLLDSARHMRDCLYVGEMAALMLQSDLPDTAGREGRTPVDSPVLMVNASEGGIYAALWKLSREAGQRLHLHGFDVELLKIPIAQETVEITDWFRINPYEMESAGCLLAVTRCPEETVDLLQQQGFSAAWIGTLTDTNDKLLRNGEETRCLDRPAADALLPILGDDC